MRMLGFGKWLVALVLVAALQPPSVRGDGSATGNVASNKVQPQLQQILQAQSSADVVIVFKPASRQEAMQQVHSPVRLLSAAEVSIGLDRDDQHIAQVVKHQQSAFELLQKPVLELLQTTDHLDSADATTTQQFWVTSNLYMSNATADLVDKIAQLDRVQEIRQPIAFTMPDTSETATTHELHDVDPQHNPNLVAGCNGYLGKNATWGVERVQAPQVWSMGYTGTGVLVGVIDTGVRADHESIRDTFVGDYGWFDPIEHATQPTDMSGHGTASTSVVVGANSIGVAPGAKWMACKGCLPRDCNEPDVVACAEFMACPTRVDGSAKDCSKRPHVINNSWGGQNRSQPVVTDMINAWIQAGIVPVFASGNDGSVCDRVDFPARLTQVIAVGATDNRDKLCSFSSKGLMNDENGIKPDLSAPGQSICSANFASTSKYYLQRGTSLAAPHVTGVVALLMHAQATLVNPTNTTGSTASTSSLGSDAAMDPTQSQTPVQPSTAPPPASKLDTQQIKNLLFSTTEQKTLGPPGRSCSADFRVFPNVDYGHGLVNALSSLQKYLATWSGPTPQDSA